MKNTLTQIIFTSFFIASSVVDAARFLSTEYRIEVYAKHIKINGIIKIQYTFEVINNSNNKIYAITIGQKSITDNDPAIIIPDRETSIIKFFSPKGWTAVNDHMSESYQNSWNWSTNSSLSQEHDSLQPRSVNKGFSAIVLSKYTSIYNSYASLDVAGASNNTVVKVSKIDNISPTGTIAATLAPIITNRKITAFKISTSIAAKDNYDPLPEITFDTIQEITSSSAGEPVSPFGAGYTLNVANDITKGVYPTMITIPADAKIAKKFRIIYKVTDASDNQTTVSTVVTIPKQ
jgi:hypothetical protein